MKNNSKNKFTSTEYKRNIIKIWNEIAPRYHSRWAKKKTGPFNSTSKLIELAKIKKGDKVLDIACGTGLATQKFLSKVGTTGFVIGIDFSYSALRIAKNENKKRGNIDFILSDVECIAFQKKFDAITCQFGLFFFPNSKMVLSNIRNLLEKNGILSISVHGEKDSVPFFYSILDAVTRYIPDYFPPGVPSLDRFGNKNTIKNEIKKCGFKQIRVKEFNFEYSPGTFSEYWSSYLKYVAKPLKKKFNSVSPEKRKDIRKLAKQNTLKYTKNGKIVFPWKILILTANST